GASAPAAGRVPVSCARRDRAHNEKADVPRAELAGHLVNVLTEMQSGLFERAKRYRAENTRAIGTRDEFFAFFTPKNAEKPEIHGGFAVSPWCGDGKCEEEIKDALKVTIRSLPVEPLEGVDTGGHDKCLCCGREKQASAVFAKSY